jgi:hypothetical protein
LSKNWAPEDLRGTKHLLDEHRAIEEARIAKNLASWEPGKYKAGWTFSKFRRDKLPRLNPYYLALDEFETPDRPLGVPGSPKAKDYSDASEGGGTGRVPLRGSSYDHDEPEDFAPRAAMTAYKDCDGDEDKRLATADEESTLGFDRKPSLSDVMADAFKEWAGITGPPPKAVDPTVAALVESYLANGGEVHTFHAYQTTQKAKIRLTSILHPAWAGGNGIPPELRKFKNRFRAMPQTGSKLWSLTA